MTSWTERELRVLRKLWDKGDSAAQIAAALKTKTRNAVIGKARRLKLERRPTPIVPKPFKNDMIKGGVFVKSEAGLTVKPKPTYKHSDNNPYDYVPPTAKPLADIKVNECRWPFGDCPDMKFCGAPVENLSYCKDHAALGFSTRNKGGAT